MTTVTLTVLCGLPGAGKSHWAARNAADNVLLLTADQVSAEALRRALAAQQSVIVDTCALLPAGRLSLLRLGRAAGVRCHVVLFTTPWKLCELRNRIRAQPAAIDWHVWQQREVAAFAAVKREAWDRVVVVGGKVRAVGTDV